MKTVIRALSKEVSELKKRSDGSNLDIKKAAPEVAVHKTGFEKQILWQLPDKGC